MNRTFVFPDSLLVRIGFALVFVIVGLLIVVVFSPYRPILSRTEDLIGRIILLITLFITFKLAKKSKRFNDYWQTIFGLFVLTVVVSLDLLMARYLLDDLGFSIDRPIGFSLLKLSESALAVIIVVFFTKISGFSLTNLYIQKGNLKKGLTTGLISFVIAAVGSFFISPVFFGAHDLSLLKIITWLPWILVFIFSNSINEELLYRGLFLKKLDPLYGKLLSNGIIVLVFTALHVGVTYSADQMMLLFILIPLAFTWGYITQETESLIASVLFHAGMDIAIILGIFSNLS